jgi:hypothetical protein
MGGRGGGCGSVRKAEEGKALVVTPYLFRMAVPWVVWILENVNANVNVDVRWAGLGWATSE